MDATLLNMMVLLLILGIAGVLGVGVALLSSQTLRDVGLRRLMKRWLR